MAAFRPIGTRGMSEELLTPGDCELISAVVGTSTVAGNATLSATALISGFVQRSGPAGAYTDTLDSVANIYAGLSGNGPAPAIINGLGFPCRITNNTAFVQTIALGAGYGAGQGAIGTIAANTWRDFMFQFTSVQPPLVLISNTVSGSPAVTWSLPTGQFSLAQGPGYYASNIQVGAAVSGAGIAAGATVIGITQGVGGTTGVILSANATASGTNVALTFGPAMLVNSSGSGTL